MIISFQQRLLMQLSEQQHSINYLVQLYSYKYLFE